MSVYVGAPSGVVQLPFSNCRRYTTCYDCIFARDPHCAWNGTQCVDVMGQVDRWVLISRLCVCVCACVIGSGDFRCCRCPFLCLFWLNSSITVPCHSVSSQNRCIITTLLLAVIINIACGCVLKVNWFIRTAYLLESHDGGTFFF